MRPDIVPPGADTGTCRRCRVRFADTTAAVLRACMMRGPAPAPPVPLHYTAAEVLAMWPSGDRREALAWLHRRLAREREDR